MGTCMDFPGNCTTIDGSQAVATAADIFMVGHQARKRGGFLGHWLIGGVSGLQNPDISRYCFVAYRNSSIYSGLGLIEFSTCLAISNSNSIQKPCFAREFRPKSFARCWIGISPHPKFQVTRTDNGGAPGSRTGSRAARRRIDTRSHCGHYQHGSLSIEDNYYMYIIVYQ